MISFEEQPFNGVTVAQRLAVTFTNLDPSKITVTTSGGQVTVDFGGQLTPAQEAQAQALLLPVIQRRFGDFT